ncbi:hypothetical protein ACJQ40_001929 [Enterococcus faecium]|nr:hypothetical protein [Enterococcus faecium]
MKRSYFIILSCILGVFVVFAAFFSYKYLLPSAEAKTHTTETSKVTSHPSDALPTKQELLQKEGNDLKILGNYQIVTVNFKEKNNAILSDEKNNPLTFSIQVTNKNKNLFSIPQIKYSNSSLAIGDQFGLASKGNQYFAYQLEK